VTEESYFGAEELAFLDIENHAHFVQCLEDKFEMFEMFFPCPTEYNDVIKIHTTELVDVLSEDAEHPLLECYRCIRQTKG